MSEWEVNLKDGNGWQPIDEEIAISEINEAKEVEYVTRKDNSLNFIDTGKAKYRPVERNAQPLETHLKVQIEEDGDCLWALP